MRSIVLVALLAATALASPPESAAPSLPLVPSSAARELVGLRRQKRAGVALMITGACALLTIPVLVGVSWARADAATQRYANADTYLEANLALFGSFAFGMVGASLLTMGGVLFKAARGDEVRLRANELSFRF